MRQGTTSSFVNPATAIIQARANAPIKEGLKGWKRIAVIALDVFAGLLLASGTVAFSPQWKTCELWFGCILVPAAKLLRESADGWESLGSAGILNKNRFAVHKPRQTS